MTYFDPAHKRQLQKQLEQARAEVMQRPTPAPQVVAAAPAPADWIVVDKAAPPGLSHKYVMLVPLDDCAAGEDSRSRTNSDGQQLPEGYEDIAQLQTYYDRQLKTLTEMYTDLMDYNERLIVRR